MWKNNSFGRCSGTYASIATQYKYPFRNETGCKGKEDCERCDECGEDDRDVYNPLKLEEVNEKRDDAELTSFTPEAKAEMELFVYDMNPFFLVSKSPFEDFVDDL